MKANKIKVIPNNKVVTGPADLYIMDVPTPLAIPFGFFQTKKVELREYFFRSTVSRNS
ncbi:MAG: hypothetical protein IPJ26_10815 [Bacteroidetes bacterium]|nr:hypothetical protein [Bacteroidota bacterium]